MLTAANSWTSTLLLASLAIAFAAVGLGLTGLYPGAAPLVSVALLVGSLGCTAGAFAQVALRVRRLELENEGLIEELSQEFDRVKDKIEIFAEALAEPRTLQPEVVESADVPMRRVAVK